MTIAAIERLPVELLQPIFAASDYNLALVQASSILATRLSSEYVYNNTCDYYLTDRCDDYVTRSASQTAIFASKWMTWGFFKSWVTRTYECNGCLCSLTPQGGCFDAQWPPNFKDATTMVFSRSHLPRLAFVRCRMPKKLLCGPWTPDKVQFLRFLLWTTSMTVDWQDSETSRLAVEGRRQAFMERNLEAVELFNHNRRLGKVPSMETVRFAVVDAGCDWSVVYDTLRTVYKWRQHGAAWEHAELDQWCIDRTRDNDTRGTWLQGILQALRRSATEPRDKGIDSDICFGKLVDEAVEGHSIGTGSALVRHQLPWNKEQRQIGWFYWSRHDTQKRGVHRVTRENLADFWKYRGRRYATITGLCRNGRGGFAVRLEMWIPGTEALNERNSIAEF